MEAWADKVIFDMLRRTGTEGNRIEIVSVRLHATISQENGTPEEGRIGTTTTTRVESILNQNTKYWYTTPDCNYTEHGSTDSC